MKKNCKECPWVVKSTNNINFTNHAKQYNKAHNCHMIPGGNKKQLWNIKEDCICIGSKKNIKQRWMN